MFKKLSIAVRQFLKLEAASGIVLIAAALVAVAFANSAYRADYLAALGTVVGPYTISIWINDALMALFFFVVGMEIKSELIDGSLASRDRALFPVIAAIGGMVVPAFIFLAFAGGGEYARGWGIPMATDIAFAVGVMALLGSRVPVQIKVFLLALAIADDLGAVLVIAIFYSKEIHLLYLGLAIVTAASIWLLAQKGLRALLLFLPLGILTWWLVHHSGVHATIAGCVLGFLMPHGKINSPLSRWVHRLHPVSGFVVMPLFALANAGLSFQNFNWSELFTNSLVSGISYGLLIGKPLGIFGAAYIAVKLGLAKLPDNVRYSHVLGAAALGGIGFTMSLFISGLALDSPSAQELAKIGIVKGSLVSAVVGSLIFLLTSRGQQPDRA